MLLVPLAADRTERTEGYTYSNLKDKPLTIVLGLDGVENGRELLTLEFHCNTSELNHKKLKPLHFIRESRIGMDFDVVVVGNCSQKRFFARPSIPIPTPVEPSAKKKKARQGGNTRANNIPSTTAPMTW